MLYPASADVLEFSFFHILTNSSKEFRIVHLEPFVLLGRRTGEAVLRIFIHEVALGGPGTCHFAYIFPYESVLTQRNLSKPGNLTFGFVKWPEPTGVNVAMPRGINKGISISVVDLCRIDIISHISRCNLTAFDNRFLRSWDKCIHDFIGDLSGRMRFLFAA